jgi:hypothetical protein
MTTTKKLTHPALMERDLQTQTRITLLGSPRKNYTPTHTVLRSELEINALIDRKAAWGLPAAPIEKIRLNPDVCDIWATQNSIARHLGLRVSAASKNLWGKYESLGRVVWGSRLMAGLRQAGFDFEHGFGGLHLDKRRSIVINNKCFALKHAGKFLVKDRATFWGGFDYCFESVHDTHEAAVARAAYLNTKSHQRNNDCFEHSFSVVKGGSSKVFGV